MIVVDRLGVTLEDAVETHEGLPKELALLREQLLVALARLAQQCLVALSGLA